MNWIIENWQSILSIIAGVVAVASVIVRLTPSKKDNKIFRAVLRILEMLALTPKDRKNTP